jgi:hypothetical protein
MSIYTKIICSCIICKKEYSDKGIHSHYRISHTEVGKQNHIKNASSHGRKAAKTRAINYSIKKEKEEIEYLKSPSKCAHCQKDLPFNKKNNPFCNHSCSTSFSNSKRSHTQKSKDKISNSLKDTLIGKR